MRKHFSLVPEKTEKNYVFAFQFLNHKISVIQKNVIWHFSIWQAFDKVDVFVNLLFKN